MVSFNPNSGLLTQSYPRDDGRGWVTEWESTFSTQVVAVKAVCMYVPSARYDDLLSSYRVVSAQWAVRGLLGGPSGFGEVSCPAGLKALAGGAFTNEQAQMRLTTSFLGEDEASWEVWVSKQTAAFERVTVVKAVCAFVP